MRWGLERVQPARRSWDILGQIWQAVHCLVCGVDCLVCPSLDLIAIGDVLEVWVVLIAGGSSKEYDTEQDKASKRGDDL